MAKMLVSVLFMFLGFPYLHAAESDINEKIMMLCSEAECWVDTLEEGTNSGSTVEMFQRAVDGQANKGL